ncbi:YcxB family protein [Thalassotalea agarivorans]|uniref:YcxB-like protein n=1 Tax=Thalassotalea agarivorans TaxID=349064 RepID=A0A1I0B181_THASX|nr:YcxB family protein [Thalassotalea agarivorans]SET00401.1 YcxB-like protein [Thalassotalea agarivorans]
MSESFLYTTSYQLDKPYFIECFEESAEKPLNAKSFTKSYGFLAVAFAVFAMAEVSDYLAWFFVGLAAVEALSIYYQKAWWVTRQMWSRASHETVSIQIDDTGIQSQTRHLTSTIEWQHITAVAESDRGFVFSIEKGRSYLSKSCLTEEAIAFIKAQINVD